MCGHFLVFVSLSIQTVSSLAKDSALRIARACRIASSADLF
jgi:hypothetical protein